MIPLPVQVPLQVLVQVQDLVAPFLVQVLAPFPVVHQLVLLVCPLVPVAFPPVVPRQELFCRPFLAVASLPVFR